MASFYSLVSSHEFNRAKFVLHGSSICRNMMQCTEEARRQEVVELVVNLRPLLSAIPLHDHMHVKQPSLQQSSTAARKREDNLFKVFSLLCQKSKKKSKKEEKVTEKGPASKVCLKGAAVVSFGVK